MQIRPGSAESELFANIGNAGLAPDGGLCHTTRIASAANKAHGLA